MKRLNYLSYAALWISAAGLFWAEEIRTNLILCIAWGSIVLFTMISRLILYKTEADTVKLTSDEVLKMEKSLYEDMKDTDEAIKYQLEWNAFMAVQRVRIYLQESGR